MINAPAELVLNNARLVLADEVVAGSVLIVAGNIAEVGGPVLGGIDLDGDYLIPGCVELHTDHLETHYAPRPRVRWNPLAAVQAHDAQIAASGITTVFDALRVGLDEDSEMGAGDMLLMAEAIRTAKAAGRLRADHYVHLRCEVSAPDCLSGFELLQADPLVRLASLMDHAPGQRQFASLEAYKAYYQGRQKLSDSELDRFSARRTLQSETYAEPHRQAIATACHARAIVLASHDDATLRHVEKSIELGIHVAEFPTTLEAARASHTAGMAVLMGAPNVVRGGSHSGNISARELADAGLLDLLSSDYIPFSLLQAAFLLGLGEPALGLPAALHLVARNPARAMGLMDRGEIAPRMRADLVRVRIDGGVPLVREVWRAGERVI